MFEFETNINFDFIAYSINSKLNLIKILFEKVQVIYIF